MSNAKNRTAAVAEHGNKTSSRENKYSSHNDLWKLLSSNSMYTTYVVECLSVGRISAVDGCWLVKCEFYYMVFEIKLLPAKITPCNHKTTLVTLLLNLKNIRLTKEDRIEKSCYTRTQVGGRYKCQVEKYIPLLGK